MKHHINLYGAEFRPKRLWASLNQMALVWGGCLLLLVAATFFYGYVPITCCMGRPSASCKQRGIVTSRP